MLHVTLYPKIQAVVTFTIAAAITSQAATITTNIKNGVVCPSEYLTINCTAEGNYQRWTVMNEGGEVLAHYTFTTSGSHLGTYSVEDYHFTLLLSINSRLESSFSTVVTNALNHATVECADSLSRESASVMIKGEPSSPQGLSITSIERHSNYSTIIVMWEPANIDSFIDFYQYQLIDNLTEVRVSNTTNTTAVLSGVPYNVNMSFVIFAFNCRGESEQTYLLFIILSTEALPMYTTSMNLLDISLQTASSVLKTPAITHSPKLNQTQLTSVIYIMAGVGSGMLILCFSVVLTAVCTWRAAVAKKKVASSKAASDTSSREYDDIVSGPVYETVAMSRTLSDLTRDTNVSMTENEAYKALTLRLK